MREAVWQQLQLPRGEHQAYCQEDAVPVQQPVEESPGLIQSEMLKVFLDSITFYVLM